MPERHDWPGQLKDISYDKAVAGYKKAVVKGVSRSCPKMGISDHQVLLRAQIFEAVGLARS